MAPNPNQSVARFSGDIDPTLRRTVQDLFDRVNFLLQEVERLKAVIAEIPPAPVVTPLTATLFGPTSNGSITVNSKGAVTVITSPT